MPPLNASGVTVTPGHNPGVAAGTVGGGGWAPPSRAGSILPPNLGGFVVFVVLAAAVEWVGGLGGRVVSRARQCFPERGLVVAGGRGVFVYGYGDLVVCDMLGDGACVASDVLPVSGADAAGMVLDVGGGVADPFGDSVAGRHSLAHGLDPFG